jgi:Ras-related protein Rab-11A
MEEQVFGNANLKTTLVLLGQVAVGKTSIVRRRTKNKFDSYSESTIGAAFSTYSSYYGDKLVRFEIWDTAGQERYKCITPLYYRNATSVFLVYDITDRTTFNAVQDYIKEIRKYNCRNPVIVLVGNKSDLEHRRKISKNEGQVIADEHNIFFIEISAKTSLNLDKAFELVANNLDKVILEPKNKSIDLSDINSDSDENNRYGCCGIL